MADETKEELIEEIKLLKKRIAELEKLDSARKQQQQQEEEEEEEVRRLATVVRDSNDAITIQDFEGQIIAWNHGAELMYGYSEEEALGMNIGRLTPLDREAEQKEFTRRLIAGEAVTSFETQRVAKDGRILDVWLTVTKLVDDTGKPVGIASTECDITERKKAEEDLRRLNIELEERVEQRTAELEIANKELEAFSFSVSHDLRAPLRTIDGFSQALQEDCVDKLDSQSKDYLQRIRQGVKNMAELIDGLLELSRIARKEIEHQPVDLTKTARKIALGFQEAEPQRQVEFFIQEGIVVNGDAHLLVIVLQNLLDNAWKFTSKHPSAKIEFGTKKINGEEVYFVRDDGAGFDMAYVGKLFAPFQRVHSTKDFPGTGVGLATVQRIIHRHGGRVWAEGEIERGACFYFTLPK
jgi:PAS domain S-box-containing protein